MENQINKNIFAELLSGYITNIKEGKKILDILQQKQKLMSVFSNGYNMFNIYIDIVKEKLLTYDALSQDNDLPQINYFQQVASEMCNIGETWNGDKNYLKIGDDFFSLLNGFCFKLIQNKPIKSHNTKVKQTKLSNNFLDFIDISMQQYMSDNMDKLWEKIEKTDMIEQAIYINCMWRMIFRERAISNSKRSVEGKGNKAIFLYLYTKMAEKRPDEAIALLKLISHYGYMKDYNYLIQYYIDIEDKFMLDNIISYYINMVDMDIRILFDGLGLIENNGPTMSCDIFHTKVKTLYDNIRIMTPCDITSNYSSIITKLSNVLKWFPRPGHFIIKEKKKCREYRNKQFSNQLPFLYEKLYSIKWDEENKSTQNFYEMITRYLLTSGNTLLNVIELRFSQQQYNYIYPEKTPSKAFATKRMAFLNEKINSKLSNDENITGNRSTDIDRIDLRERTLIAAKKDKLKVLVESNNFADILKRHNLYGNCNNMSEAEQLVVESLWRKHIEDITIRVMKDYNTSMDKWRENGMIENMEPLHPLDCIATIDTSGSMECADVHYEAVINGLTVAEISRMAPGIFITFHETPTLINVSKEEGFIAKFIKASMAPWGRSTNIDRANELLIKIVVEVKKRNPLFKKFIHIIFTDMGFDMASGNDYSSWNTFVERYVERFNNLGLDLPLTCFHNMNCNSPGFPATSDMKGIILCEGLGTSLLPSALGGGVAYTNNLADMNNSYLKSLYRTDFDKVTIILIENGQLTKKGVFADPLNTIIVQSIIAAYQ